MTATPTARQAAIEMANEAYASIREYVEGIPETDMLRPNRVGIWSGKDLVAHIADWEREGVRVLSDLVEGKEERWLPDERDLNTFNEQRIAELSNLSLSGALEYWSVHHAGFLDAYRGADIDRDDLLMAFTRDHYRDHYPDFRHVKPFRPLSEEERAALLNEMDAAQQQLVDLIDSISDEKLLQPDTVGIWSGKDLIAHLGHWLEAAAHLTRELENDRPGKWPGEDGSNINEWNEARVRQMRGLDLDEVRAYQRGAFDDLRELIRTSPFATRSAGVGATSFHYGLHEEDFRSLR